MMSYGDDKPIMSEGGSSEAASSRTESRPGGIMTGGGRNLDFGLAVIRQLSSPFILK